MREKRMVRVRRMRRMMMRGMRRRRRFFLIRRMILSGKGLKKRYRRRWV